MSQQNRKRQHPEQLGEENDNGSIVEFNCEDNGHGNEMKEPELKMAAFEVKNPPNQ
jgi:hypothetical protein